ncbi:myosin-11-like [Durio zibethinus]|uniref:Myosin-11-like n=1 Tax=Durio zibethinus TaxID=66656 RepID=A0A6P5YX20_DURZI|nr:myosin-11-like [Durio zibethinus]
MFRLHKTRPIKSGEKIDFKFSNFKAVQVPKGWDRLFMSIISLENEKTIAKTKKAVVRDGICQWTETLSESIWVSRKKASKEMEDYLFKLVVAMGSAKSGILGEATVNMTGYVNSNVIVPVSLPLEKCNHGTILQVNINCLTPRPKTMDDEPKQTDCDAKCDLSFNSCGPESVLATSVSSPCQDLFTDPRQGELQSREASFSTSDSHHSYDSAESSIGRESFSPTSNLCHETHNLIQIQDSLGSQNNLPDANCHLDDLSQSNHSSFDSQIIGSQSTFSDNQQEFSASTLRVTDSSKYLLEAAEKTIEELLAEAKMWERNAYKLILDLDMLRKEYSDQSKSLANLDMELSTANLERDALRKEVEQLKLLLEKSMVKQITLKDSTFQDGGVTHIQKELENEIKFQKESNVNLALQLKRSQDANVELVSVLHELLGTTEKQRVEMENISALKSQFSELESYLQLNTEENRNLQIQLQQSKESEKNLQAKVQHLEKALKDKEDDMDAGMALNSDALLDIEEEYRSKLAAKEREIVGLEVKLSESLKERHFVNLESRKGGDAHLIREIEALKAKLGELKSDCNELTDENLQLLLKLKETKNNFKEGVPATNFSSDELSASTGFELSENMSQMLFLEEKLKKKILREIQSDYNSYIQELESQNMELEAEVTEVGKKLTQKRTEIQTLEATMQSKEEENVELRRNQSKLEAKVSNLQREKAQLEDKLQVIQRESVIATKCLDDLQNDSSSMDSGVSAELEIVKHELEIHLLELEDENKLLSLRLSLLEAQLEDLKDERDSTQMQLEDSKSLVTSLKDEITRSRNEMEARKTDMGKQPQDMHDQWLASEEKCEYLRRANTKLQETTETLIEECNSLQRSVGDSRKEKSKLDKHCAHLEAKLRESDKSLTDCRKKIEVLEENLTLVIEDFASKEESLTLELDAIHDKSKKLEAKLKLEESSWNQMYLQKTKEVENLQQEVENLAKQLSEAQNEKEKTAYDALREISGLHAGKVELESALQEGVSKMKLTESEFKKIQTEAKTKMEDLLGELAASRENQETLMAEHEKALRLLESYKSSEGKLKTIMNGLELKLTVSEYERQQVSEQSTNMKVQLLKIENLQDDILALRNECNAIKADKEKLEASLHLLSGECDDLKAEKNSFLGQISTLQKVVSELEDYKPEKVALEEKLVRMEGDRLAKEALLLTQFGELKNELHQIKRTNRLFQQQIKQLQHEKDELLIKAQTLEEKLKLKVEEKQKQRQSNSHRNQHKREDNSYDAHEHDGSLQAVGVDPVSKIQLLENELAKAMEANNTYKVRLSRLSDGRKSRSNSPRKSSIEGEVVAKEKYESTKSSLEAELRDIRERYRHMSLKYAEVEAQREELVMKLRGVKSMRRWFSNPSN